MLEIQYLQAKDISYSGTRDISKIKYIVLHYTGNEKDTAKNNANYFSINGSNTRKAGAMFFVDETSIYQTLNDTQIGNSVGGGTQSSHHPYYKICTNANSISIEMCTSGNYEVSEQTEANALELTKYLMKKYNIDVNHVIRHYDVNGKSCPSVSFRNGDRWSKFISKLGGTVQEIQVNNPTVTTSKNYLSKGDKGSDVKDMQTKLIACGYSCGKSGADGDFGSGTKVAVENFQRDHGLTVDGKFGTKSKAKLDSVYASKTAKPTNNIIALGQQHSINFTGHSITVDGIKGSNTLANIRRCVQHAINLDYGKNIAVDSYFQTKSKNAFGNHYVKRGETQYLVTALEIALMCHGYNPSGVECPGVFGSGLEACIKQYQTDHGLKADGVAGKNTFYSLMGI